jgi:hypothetical protein
MKNNDDFLGYLLLKTGNSKFILQLDEVVMNEITTDESIQGTAYLYPNKHIDYLKADFYSNYNRENIQDDIKEFVSDYIYNRDAGAVKQELKELKNYIHNQIADRITGYGMYIYWVSNDKILKISVDREAFMKEKLFSMFQPIMDCTEFTPHNITYDGTGFNGWMLCQLHENDFNAKMKLAMTNDDILDVAETNDYLKLVERLAFIYHQIYGNNLYFY